MGPGTFRPTASSGSSALACKISCRTRAATTSSGRSGCWDTSTTVRPLASTRLALSAAAAAMRSVLTCTAVQWLATPGRNSRLCALLPALQGWLGAWRAHLCQGKRLRQRSVAGARCGGRTSVGLPDAPAASAHVRKRPVAGVVVDEEDSSMTRCGCAPDALLSTAWTEAEGGVLTSAASVLAPKLRACARAQVPGADQKAPGRGRADHRERGEARRLSEGDLCRLHVRSPTDPARTRELGWPCLSRRAHARACLALPSQACSRAHHALCVRRGRTDAQVCLESLVIHVEPQLELVNVGPWSSPRRARPALSATGHAATGRRCAVRVVRGRRSPTPSAREGGDDRALSATAR